MRVKAKCESKRGGETWGITKGTPRKLEFVEMEVIRRSAGIYKWL